MGSKTKKRLIHLKNNENNIKAIVALLILLLGFSTLIIFQIYKDNIMAANAFKPFMTLTVLFMGFLIGLLYLINKSSVGRK